MSGTADLGAFELAAAFGPQVVGSLPPVGPALSVARGAP